MYQFGQVKGYPDMPVVCWRRDAGDAWVYDGRVLDARSTEKLMVTFHGKNDILALRNRLNMKDLVEFLASEAVRWPTTTEYAARHDILSPSYRKELEGIDAFRSFLCERHGAEYASKLVFPAKQNSAVDMMLNEERIQFKTLDNNKGVKMLRKNGITHDGKKLKKPYDSSDFDSLVVVCHHETGFLFWKIPSHVLTDEGILSTSTQPGKTCFSINKYASFMLRPSGSV